MEEIKHIRIKNKKRRIIMVTVEFRSQRATKGSVEVFVTKSGELALENNFSFRTLFSPDNRQAKAIINLSVADPEHTKIVIDTVTEGFFNIDGVETDTDRKVVNTKCFDQLFEYASGHVKTLASMAGIPDLPVPKPEFDFDDIHVNHPVPAGLTS